VNKRHFRSQLLDISGWDFFFLRRSASFLETNFLDQEIILI